MSEFWERKVRTFFKQLDVNNDGYISLKDIEVMVDLLCDAAKVDAAEKKKLNEKCAKLWRMYMKSAESDDNGLLTPSILFESVKQQRNDPEFKETYLATLQNVFSPWDVNGDGFLQEDEYTRAFAEMGFQDANIARRAFEAADTNKDRKLSWVEFSKILFEHLTSEDENSP